MDQADIRPRMITTARASQPICFHMEMTSNPTSCKSISPRIFNCTIIRSHSSSKFPARCRSLHNEIHSNCCDDLNRLAVQHCSLVAPLLYCLDVRFLQQCVTTDHSQVLNGSLGADRGGQKNNARNAGGPS